MEIPIARPIARDGRTLKADCPDQSEVRVTRGCLVFLTVIAALTADRRQPDRDLRNRRAFFWIWDAAAAIAAVPLLIFSQTISSHVPSLRPVGPLLATAYAEGEKNRRC